jgi:hypothetical protein
MDIVIFIIFMVVLTIVIVILSSHSARLTTGMNNPPSPIIEKSHAWHEPTGEYGSNHADIVDDHVVSHPQPEIGYVVLNGVKRKLEDCKWL